MRIHLIALPIALFLALPAAAQDIGSVREVRDWAYGTPEASNRRDLFARTKVTANERVETVANGGLHLRFLDRTDFHLGPESVVFLDEFVYDRKTSAGKMALTLSKGTFRFISGKMKKDLITLRTPTALIGIRGTNFLVSVADNGATGIIVEEGEVDVTPNLGGGDTVAVLAGSTVAVTATGAVEVGAQVTIQDPAAAGPGDGGQNESEGGSAH
jgi:hypothetical protein